MVANHSKASKTFSLLPSFGFIDYLGFLGQIGHPLLGERGPNDATG